MNPLRCEWCGTNLDDHGPHHGADVCRDYLKAALGAANRDAYGAKLALVQERDRGARAEAEVERLRTALEALHDHVLSAAPLSWAASGNAEAAHLWEIKLDDIREAVTAALRPTAAQAVSENDALAHLSHGDSDHADEQ